MIESQVISFETSISESEISKELWETLKNIPFEFREIRCNHIDFDFYKMKDVSTNGVKFEVNYKIALKEHPINPVDESDYDTYELNVVIKFSENIYLFQYCIKDEVIEISQETIKLRVKDSYLLDLIKSLDFVSTVERFDEEFKRTLACQKYGDLEFSSFLFESPTIFYESKNITKKIELDENLIWSPPDVIYKDNSNKYFRYIYRDVVRESYICIKDYSLVAECSTCDGATTGTLYIYEESALVQLLKHDRLMFMFPDLSCLEKCLF